MRTYRLRLSEGRWGCVGGVGLAFIPESRREGCAELSRLPEGA